MSNVSVALVIMFVAFLVKVYVAASESGYGVDMNCFMAWGNMMNTGEISEFYTSGAFADYPPLYMYVLGGISAFCEALGIAVGSQGHMLLVRMPSIIADFGIAYIMYRFASRRVGKDMGMLLAFVVAFMPMMTMDSSSWGQIDSVFTLVLVGALYMLYVDKKAFSIALFMVGLLIKPQMLLIAPLFAIVFIVDLLRKDKWKRTLIQTGIGLAAAFAIYVVVALPMQGTQSFFYVFERMFETTSQYQYASVNAANVFSLFGQNWVSDAQASFLLPNYIWGIIGIVVTIAVCGFIYFKKKDKRQIFMLAGIMLVGIFMLGHNMHERYIYPGVIMLLFAAVQLNNRKILLTSMLFSGAAFVNMQAVLIFQVSVAVPQYLIILISALNVAIFAYLVCVVIKHIFRGETAPTIDFVALPEPPRISLGNAARRLLSYKTHDGSKIVRKDLLIMVAITAVYAVLAFTNLGSTVIPERNDPIDSENTTVTITLDAPNEISSLRYYAGYSEGDFTVSYNNGVDDVEVGVEHAYADMFKWKTIQTPGYTDEIVITLNEGYLEFREIAVVDAADNILTIAQIDKSVNGQTFEYSEAIDEQDQVKIQTTHMTDMYFDEVYHARTAYEYMEGIYPYEITHPPLGKSIITLGVEIFGFTPFGWRFMGALFGVLMLPVLYILAKRLLKKTRWAAIATGLFAADFMHYTLTRIATIDSFSIFFILCMALFMYDYTRTNFNKQSLAKTLIPLGLAGIAWAFGLATKWLVVYAGVGIAVIFFYTIYQRAKEARYAKFAGLTQVSDTFKKKLIITLSFCVLMFVIVPLFVYVLSYAPYEAARPGYGLDGIIANQEYMLNYHAYLDPDTVHPFQSSVYTWPLDIRPVFFFSGSGYDAGTIAGISTFVNPIIAWGGLAAVIYLLALRKNTGSFKGIGFVAVMGLSGIIPWILITREVYIYHYFTALPFLILTIVYVMRSLYSKGKAYKYGVWAFVGLCVIMFACFYPMLTGIPVSTAWSDVFRWLPSWPFY